MTEKELEKVYLSRPFKTRNADEYDLENVLDLFIDPTDGLIGPFEFSNSIIKGKMGSGKTMYLRANYAYYLYTLVPCLLDSSPVVLPVYIRLSDFQNMHNSENIYYAIIVKIIEEIVSICKHLQSTDELYRLHTGACTICSLWSTDKELLQILEKLRKLTADEYIEKVSKSFTTEGSITASFVELCTNYESTDVCEMKRRDKPSFQNVVDTCQRLLSPFSGKLLILFDEVGSIDKNFFKNTDGGDSFFETLMNQLRTLPYVRTKLAVYPHSYSDILKETRYGDIIELECDVSNNNVQFQNFMVKTVSLIERYIEKSYGEKCHAEDVFKISREDQILIEQLINASEGNMRRLVHLLDSSMTYAYSRCHGTDRITVEDVLESLARQGAEMEGQYQDTDKEFLGRLAKVCRSRSTYKFTFPNKSTIVNKYTSLSEEYNVINIRQAGSGRQSTVYGFDYAYCIYKDIPTHYVKDSEKIDKSRSSVLGEPIKRVAQLSDEILIQSELRGKIEGRITYLDKESLNGFVEGSDNQSYFITTDAVIASGKKVRFHVGDRVRFIPSKLNNTTLTAREVEIL
jgi:hypothetical protein